MSLLKALWFACGIWFLAVGTAGFVLGVSSWAGSLTLLVLAAGPFLLARYVSAAPEPSLSQSIQRELR